MHTLVFSFVILSLVLSSFHDTLVNGDFNLQSGQLQGNQFKSLINAAVVDGNLSLDATTGDAQAFYSDPINFLDSVGSLHSFSSFFTFSSNESSGNGTIAFVLTPLDDSAPVSLATARNTFTLEFNTNCSGNGSGFGGGNWGRGNGRGFGPGNWGGNEGGFFNGGLGGFQVVEYAKNTSITPQNFSGYGPSWNDQVPYNGPYFCTQQGTPPFYPADPADDLTFQYQVVFEYNASTHTVSVGSPSCGGTGFARTTELAAQDLSRILTKPLYVGFLASGKGVYSISQWNFTSNAATNFVSSLALSTGTSSTTSSTGSGAGSSSGWHSAGGGLGKGAVIGFSILGGVIGIAAVFLVCCLCERRKRVTSTRAVATKSVHAGVIPESAVIFDARKPNAPPVRVVLPAERDTIPLNASSDSAFHASTGGAAWLHPVAPR